MAWIRDTNILSELRRSNPEPKVLAFVAGLPLAQVYVSVVSFAEIRFGIELVSSATQRADLNDWLTNTIRPMFVFRGSLHVHGSLPDCGDEPAG